LRGSCCRCPVTDTGITSWHLMPAWLCNFAIAVGLLCWLVNCMDCVHGLGCEPNMEWAVNPASAVTGCWHMECFRSADLQVPQLLHLLHWMMLLAGQHVVACGACCLIVTTGVCTVTGGAKLSLGCGVCHGVHWQPQPILHACAWKLLLPQLLGEAGTFARFTGKCFVG
jgi:hypothetical protein